MSLRFLAPTLATILTATTALPAAEPPMTPDGKWKVHDKDRPRPRVMTPPGFSTAEQAGSAPSDATVLFDGKDLSKWKRDRRKDEPETADEAPFWKVEHGYMEIVPGSGTLRTREKIAGDTQWHLEWATPAQVEGSGQGRGNSGVFIGGFPEVQVLDSYENDTYPDGQAAGLYGRFPPMVNASRKPGEWQSYDIFIERQRKDASGAVVKKARITVIHNGVVVHLAREVDASSQEGDLALQDHGNPVRYRNIWVRPINLTDPDREGTLPPTNAATVGKKAAVAVKPAAAGKPAEGMRVVRIKTPAAQMRYDLTEFTVAPGTPVKLILENTDDMPHNWVLYQAGVDVVAATNKNMEKPEDALKRDWLPDDPRILAHSRMVQPKSTDEVLFTAPAKPGMYPYVCTFPGHALSMQGKMRVARPGPGFTSLTYAVYLGDWQQLPDFSTLKPHREGEIPDRLLQLDFDDYKNQYGVVFTAELPVPKDAEYRFYLASDDGARLLIDGKVVVEHDGIHPAGSIRDGKVTLKKGIAKVRLEYFQGDGEAEIFLAWRGGGFAATPLSKWAPEGFDNSSPKRKEEPPPMPITVAREPVIYRNFIAGAGTRGIGIGYPGGFNVAWSAAHANLAVLWRGAFIDAGKHWTDRGGGAQLPLGFDAIRPTGELSPPLAILAAPTDEWPKSDPKEKQEGFVWRGYTLDAQRFPTFLYEWNRVQVSERLAVQGDASAGGKLTRTLRLTGPIPANAWFRVATGASIQPADGGFLVKDGSFALEGRGYENHFWVAADGAQVAGKNLLLPARAEIVVTYAWPGRHAHHAH